MKKRGKICDFKMLQFVNSSVAMEADTISKNGLHFYFL